MEVIVSPNIVQLAASTLKPSPFNPRSELPNLEELQESIAAVGLLEPLLVRPLPDGGTEIVDGHRRYAAAVAVNSSGMEMILPCVMQVLTDEQVKEIQLIKALQREGLHPYDEARHIEKLFESNNREYAAVAAKIGKPERYVRRRHVLINLIPKFAKEFSENRMTLGQAFTVARVPAAAQEKVFAMKKSGHHTDWDFVGWATRNQFSELARAPWKLDDAELYPEAGACSVCPKQSNREVALFEEFGKKENRCTDLGCFDEKFRRHFERLKEKEPKAVQISSSYGTSAKGVLKMGEFRQIATNAPKCESATVGVVAEGFERGKQVPVCINPKCKVHANSRGDRPVKTEAEVKARKKEIREEKVVKLASELLIGALAAKEVSTLRGMRQIVSFAWDRCWHEMKMQIAKLLKVEPGKAVRGGKDYDTPVQKLIDTANSVDELKRLALMFSFSRLMDNHFGDSERVKVASQFGLQFSAFKDEARRQLDAGKLKTEAPAKKKRPASKKKKLKK